MNKTFKFMTLAVAAMSMAACSSEDALETAEAPVHWNADGSGYVAFNLSMPTNTGGRFAVKRQANDKFDNGEEGEYAVKNAILLIFDGEEESTAKFHSAYVLEDKNWNTANSHANPNVTIDNKFVVEVAGAPAHPKALVVLNNNGLFTVDAATHSLKVQNVDFPVGHAFSELVSKTQSEISLTADKFGAEDVANKGILMTNAPLYSQPGESSDPNKDEMGTLQLLVTVDASHVHPTKAEAEKAEAAAASIYVERAVAKVTVKAKDDTNVAAADAPFTAKMENWTLDNTNKTSYLVRNTSDFTEWSKYHINGKYRMVGHESVGHDAPISAGVKGDAGYRTYFAKDPNFDTEVVYGTTTNKAAFADNQYSKLETMGASQYCAENTFDVARMKYGNTTRAIVKAKITPTDNTKVVDGGFYSRPGDNVFYTEENMKTLLKNSVNSYLVKLKDAGAVTISGEVGYTITSESGHTKFKVVATNVAVVEGTIDAKDKTIVEALKGAGYVYSIHTIGYDYYADGVCYYDTRIQHFGQDHTPWTAHDASNVEEAYKAESESANAAVSYLGRWGVLRNNWYELTVNSVAKIGYAHPWNLSFDPADNPTDGSVEDPTKPPYDPNTPDDNQKSELWLSVDVNILSWAKRTQQVDF